MFKPTRVANTQSCAGNEYLFKLIVSVTLVTSILVTTPENARSNHSEETSNI